MTSPDSAKVNYQDKCSNGSNIDKVNRDKFLKLMLANKRSKLSQLKVVLLNQIKQSGEEPRGKGQGDLLEDRNYFPIFNEMGCIDSVNVYGSGIPQY